MIPPTSDDVISYLGEHIDNAFRDAFGSVGFLDAIKNELKFREEVRTNVSKAFSNLSIDLIGLKIGQMHVPHVVRNRFFWLNAAKVDPRQVLWAETAHLVSQADRAMGQDLVLHLGDEKKSLTRSRPKKE